MFDDAQEIEDNFQACQKLPEQILDENADVEKDDEVYVKEQVFDPTFLDDIPIFDDYNDDFLELLDLSTSSESDSFHKSNDIIHSICHNMVQK